MSSELESINKSFIKSFGQAANNLGKKTNYLISGTGLLLNASSIRSI